MVENTRRLPRYWRRHAATRYAVRTLLRVMPMRERGWPLWRCADNLNRAGWKTFSGCDWSVGRLGQIIRLGQIEAMDEFARTQDRRWIRPATSYKGDSAHAE